MKDILATLGKALLLLAFWRIASEIAAYISGRDGDSIMLSWIAATLAVHLVSRRAHPTGEKP